MWINIRHLLFVAAIVACLPSGTRAQTSSDSLSIELAEGVRLELAEIPAGEFRQGSDTSEADRKDDESQREVTISKPFLMGRYPVTKRQFAAFVKASGYRTEAESGPSGGFGWVEGKLVQRKEFTWRNPGYPQTDDHPVTLVTYPDALAFLAWASGKAGRKLELPTEAQWEYAYRAGTSSPWPWGDRAEGYERFASIKSSGTWPVDAKAPNAFGLYAMSGNVQQWCRDWYAPYDLQTKIDPEQTRNDLSDKPRRVLRGAAFHQLERHLRSASRYRNDPRARNADNGFRVASTVTNKTSSPTPEKSKVESPPSPAPAPQTPAIGTPVEATDVSQHEPVIPSSPPARGAVRRSGVPFGAICCLLAFFGIFAIPLMLWMLLSGSRSQNENVLREPISPPNINPMPRAVVPPIAKPSGGGGGGSRIRLDQDGFWLDLAGLALQSEIQYRFFAGGKEHRDRYVKRREENETFIYTGDQPTEGEVTGIGRITSSPDEFAFLEEERQRRMREDASAQNDVNQNQASQDTNERDDNRPSSFSSFPSAY